MSKRWLTSDWHLGEDRFAIMNRPFSSPQEMIDVMVLNHNKLVAPGDIVYMLGDVCYNKHPEFLEQVERFNGIKRLIRGNHDRDIPDEEFLKYFEIVIPEGDGITVLTNDGMPVYMTHYPTQAKPDVFNAVGHIHSGWRFQLNMMNVGVDANHFRPTDLESFPHHLEAIKNYYDWDFWAAYLPINQDYFATRGKKSLYFERNSS